MHKITPAKLRKFRINRERIFKGYGVAGDCTDGLYHQDNIAAGDAVKALEDIYMELKNEIVLLSELN